MAAMRPLLLQLARHGRVLTRLQWPNPQSQVNSTALAHWNARVASCAFSSRGLNGVNGLNGDHPDDSEWDDEPPVNGDVSPFERLLQHSRTFRDGVDADDLPDGVEDESLWEELQEENEEHSHDDKDEKKDDDHHLDAPLDESDRDHTEFVGQIRKPQSHHRSAHEHPHRRSSKRWGVEQRVRREIGNADAVDFEHGLRDLDERRAREKMYTQLLVREYDRDCVCQNCGEVGHVARNCMLPVICSNCGDVGHRRHECPHISLSIDQLAATKHVNTLTTSTTTSTRRKKSDKQLQAETRRRDELQAIRQRHDRMKKAFDNELDEYLDKYEHNKKTRAENARAAGEEKD